jgi:glutamate 5-kinase
MKRRRIVIKIGSSVMTLKGRIDEKFLETIIRQVSALSKKNIDVCIVSSGAIVAGMSMLKLHKIPTKMDGLQAVASIGQAALINIYNKHFKRYRKVCGQILLTWDDFQHRERYNNAKNTFLTLFNQGVVPVVNENDTVSTEEIKFGDNDTLSALVAGMIDAEVLLLLSNVDGFDLDGKIVPVITKLERDDAYCRAVRKKEMAHTKGGMLPKLQAADLAATLGIKTVIANGRAKEVIKKVILEGSNIGTHFEPRGRISGKKKWIAFSRKSKGCIIVDKGAAKALEERNSSLLSRGIKEVSGDFLKGDTVSIRSEEANIVIGRGMVNYDSECLKKSLGQKLPREVIHRDHLVIEKWLGFSNEI